MKLNLTKIVLGNLPLKVISVILGYAFWYAISAQHTGTMHVTIPLSFYNVEEKMHIDAPESLTVQLSGKKCALRNLDITQLAIHVNAESFTSGHNALIVSHENLLLPESIAMVNYWPADTSILVQANSVNEAALGEKEVLTCNNNLSLELMACDAPSEILL